MIYGAVLINMNKKEKNSKDTTENFDKKKIENSLSDKQKKAMDSLSPDQKDAVNHILAIHQTTFSGPIPPPSILKKYNDLYPGAAQKIIDNSLEESQFRRSAFKTNQKTSSRLAWAIMIFMFTLTVLLVVLSYVLIKENKNVGGTIFGIFGGATGLAFLGTCIKSIESLTDNNRNKTKD